MAPSPDPHATRHKTHVLAPLLGSVVVDGTLPRSSKKLGRHTHDALLVAPGASVVVLKGHWMQALACAWPASGLNEPSEQLLAEPPAHH